MTASDQKTLPPDPPEILGERGAAFWRDVHETFEFDEHETVLFVETCRVLDRIEALQSVIDHEGVTATGSMGQRTIHPAVAEQRAQQATLAKLIDQLNLRETLARGGASLERPSTTAARRAADARWGKQRRASNA